MQQGSRPSRSSQGLSARPETRAFDPRAQLPPRQAPREATLQGVVLERPSYERRGLEVAPPMETPAALTAPPQADDRVLASLLVLGTIAAMVAILTAAAPSFEVTGLFQRAHAAQGRDADAVLPQEHLKPIGLSAGILEPVVTAPMAKEPARALAPEPSSEAAPAQRVVEKPRVRKATKRLTRVRAQRGVE